MKRKIVLGTILTLALVLTVAVLTVFPALANSIPSNSISHTGTVGEIAVQLPPPGGALTHPTNFKIIALDFDKRSGSKDALRVNTWVSALNTYVPVAFISDQPYTAQDKASWNNSAVYLEVNGVVIRNNLKTVADKELEIWTETPSSQYGHGRWGIDEGGRWYWWNAPGGETLIANLTAPVQLDFTGLPPIFGSSFTVPPIDMKFVGIAEGFSLGPIASNMPSGAIMTIKGTQVPAWAYTLIPAWGTGSQPAAAYIIENFALTITPPA